MSKTSERFNKPRGERACTLSRGEKKKDTIQRFNKPRGERACTLSRGEKTKDTIQLFNECVAATPQDVKQRVDWSFQIADRIDGILKERGMTQKEFAKQIGRSEAEVCRWVGGTHNFTLATLAKISATLGVPLINVAV